MESAEMTWVFKNDSQEAIPPESIVRLTGIEIRATGEIYLKGEKSDDQSDQLLAVTRMLTVDAGKYVKCEPIGNVLIGKYYVSDGTPANGETWGLGDIYRFRKNLGGGQFIVVGSDEERELVVVMAVGPRTLLGKTDGTVSADSTGTVSIYSGDLGSETDTGDNKTAYNRGDDIDADIWVELTPRGGGWEMVPLECNPA